MLMKTDAQLLQEIENFDILNKPSLERLSYLLRHEELWPKGFLWGFQWCGSCAIGLAVTVWEIEKDMFELERKTQYFPKFRDALKIDDYDFFERTFLNSCVRKTYGVYPEAITPKMVADKIDEFLEGR